jgi:sporulation protein YlmC with PRC-barrel domain
MSPLFVDERNLAAERVRLMVRCCVALCRCAGSPGESLKELSMNYNDKDQYGIYKNSSMHANGNMGPGPGLMGAETLLGNDVYNHRDEKIGDIKEIMLDMSGGKISYAVLSFGSFLGMGEKLFAVPWNALILDTENKRFTLDIEKDRLENAPGFDKDNWPDMADSTWRELIHSYYSNKTL